MKKLFCSIFAAAFLVLLVWFIFKIDWADLYKNHLVPAGRDGTLGPLATLLSSLVTGIGIVTTFLIYRYNNWRLKNQLHVGILSETGIYESQVNFRLKGQVDQRVLKKIYSFPNEFREAPFSFPVELIGFSVTNVGRANTRVAIPQCFMNGIGSNIVPVAVVRESSLVLEETKQNYVFLEPGESVYFYYLFNEIILHEDAWKKLKQRKRGVLRVSFKSFSSDKKKRHTKSWKIKKGQNHLFKPVSFALSARFSPYRNMNLSKQLQYYLKSVEALNTLIFTLVIASRNFPIEKHTLQQTYHWLRFYAMSVILETDAKQQDNISAWHKKAKELKEMPDDKILEKLKNHPIAKNAVQELEPLENNGNKQLKEFVIESIQALVEEHPDFPLSLHYRKWID